MTYDQVLPAVAKMLQARYEARFRAYRDTTEYPLPKRRSKKRKPIPGVLDTSDGEAG